MKNSMKSVKGVTPYSVSTINISPEVARHADTR